MDILIFRTNVNDRMHVQCIRPLLDHVQGIRRWTVDLHDVDKVLRIESRDVCPRWVETTLRELGYDCEELPD